MEGDTSLVMEIVLEHIYRNNFIKDRRTLLNSRLVCRAWRASKAFSSKITAVTLHMLADVQLAAEFFRSTPCQRPPWRSVEESRVFPSLKTLTVCDSLRDQLYESTATGDLLASIENMSVEVAIHDWGSEGHETKFPTIAGFISSLELIQFGKFEWIDTFFYAQNIAGLTRLTRLYVCCAPNVQFEKFLFQIEYLGILSQLWSLQQLQLSTIPVMNLVMLADCFRICETLTQLTRLELSIDVFDGGCVFPEEFDGDIESITRLLIDLAPKVLHTFEVGLYLEDRYSFYLHVSWVEGILRMGQCNSSLTVTGPEDVVQGIPERFFKAAKYNVTSHHLHFYLRCELPEGQFPVDLTAAASFKDLQISGYYTRAPEYEEEVTTMHQVDGDEHHLCALVNPDINEAKPIAILRPTLLIEQGVQMAATRFEVDIQNLDIIDLTWMIPQVPMLFPNLQHLKLCAKSCTLLCENHICQLTKLTHLTFLVDFTNYSGSSSALLALPTSLKELDIYAAGLDIVALSNLAHLTKLQVYKPRSSDSNLDAVYSCTAPLNTLCLKGTKLHVDLSALAAAFPQLEALGIDLDSSLDMSPLSHLQRLSHLEVIVMGDPVLTGVENLTSLVFLQIDTRNPDAFSNLCKLTSLRVLRLLVAFCREFKDLAIRGPELTQQLRRAMPNTEIDIRPNTYRYGPLVD